MEQDQEILHRGGQGVGLSTLAALGTLLMLNSFVFVLQFLCLKLCVYGGITVPQGGARGPSLGNHPPGGAGGGPSSLGWGRTSGGGGGTQPSKG